MRIAVVCLGNICRSPIAEVVLRDRLAAAGRSDVEVSSAGTGDWHMGDDMDPRAAATLRRHGYDPSGHVAQQYDPSRDFDLVLAMDADNLRALGGRSERVQLFRDADPEGPGDVPDPFFGEDDGFETVLAMVERTAEAWVKELPDS